MLPRSVDTPEEKEGEWLSGPAFERAVEEKRASLTRERLARFRGILSRYRRFRRDVFERQTPV
jgi:hypothetical protein